MSLPARVRAGLISIYGVDQSNNNIHVPKDYRFGIVNDTWNAVPAIGQSVLFKIDESVPVSYLNQNYWIVDENKIIIIEDPPL